MHPIKAVIHGAPDCGPDYMKVVEIPEPRDRIEISMTNGLQIDLVRMFGNEGLDSVKPYTFNAGYALERWIDGTPHYRFTGEIDGAPVTGY